MVLALLALEADRPLLCALAASAGVMSKLLPGLVAAAWARRYRAWHVLAGGVLAVALVLVYLDPEAKKTMLLSLSKYARFWRFNETLFAPLAALLGSHSGRGPGRGPCSAWASHWPWRGAGSSRGGGHGGGRAFLLLTPNVLPWYAHVAPAAARAARRAGRAALHGHRFSRLPRVPGLPVRRPWSSAGVAGARVRALRARGRLALGRPAPT